MVVNLTRLVKLVSGGSDGNSDKVVEMTGSGRQNLKG